MEYRLRIRRGDTEFEVAGDQAFVERHYKKFLGSTAPSAAPDATADLPKRIMSSATSNKLAAAEFLRAQHPGGGTETLIVLAKYLGDYRSLTDFSVKDINKIAKEARVKDVHS